METEQLTEKIIGCAFQVQQSLSPGFLEKVYENALRIELELAGLNVNRWSGRNEYGRKRSIRKNHIS